MRKEQLQQIREICARQRENLITSPNAMLDFQLVDGLYKAVRTSSFRPECQNIVTKEGGTYVMSAFSLTMRQSLRVSQLVGLSQTSEVDTLSGSFFFIPKGTAVPCHKDEEAHEGYKRNNKLLTFNVSAPLTILYSNLSGKEKDMAFAATDHFITILNPTTIHHGVIADPNEDLYLVQFPFLTTPAPAP